jgi:hypothetical protein
MAIDPTADSIVRKWWPAIVAGAVALTLLATLAGNINAALGTCQRLDRWLGLSGCSARIMVRSFSQYPYGAMVWPKGEQAISLFGTEFKGSQRLHPEIVRIALPYGEELGRIALPSGNWRRLRPSADGRQATLYCKGPCYENGNEHAVLMSTADGQIIPWPADSAPPQPQPIYRAFGAAEAMPIADDETVFSWGEGIAKGSMIRRVVDVVSPDGKYIAKPSPEIESPSSARGEIILSARSDGTIIRKLIFEKRSGIGRYFIERMLLQFSPSGRLIALLDPQQRDDRIRGSVVYIWDVESGQPLATLHTDREVDMELLWSWDEQSFILDSLSQSEGEWVTTLDIFDWPRKAAPAVRTPGAS